jgi:hypothetical protein
MKGSETVPQLRMVPRYRLSSRLVGGNRKSTSSGTGTGDG